MSDLVEQGKVIRLAAQEVLSLEQQIIELHQRSDEIERRANQSRAVLLELITTLRNSAPEGTIPSQFITHGILIHSASEKDCLLVHSVPDLDELVKQQG